MPTDKDGNPPPGYEAWAGRQRDRERRDDPGHAGPPPLRGTPCVVIERMKAVQEAGIDHIFGDFGFPGLPHWKTMRSVELFATQVMPHFKEALAKVWAQRTPRETKPPYHMLRQGMSVPWMSRVG